MAFDRAGFIKTAKERGIEYEEINAYLATQGVEPVSKVEKIILDEKIPKAFAALGGVGGGILGLGGGPAAAVTVPGGAAGGGFVGYGAGKVANESLKRMAGLSPETPKEYTSKALLEAGKAGFTTGSIAELPYLIKALLTPLETTKNVAMNVRKKSIGGMSDSAEQAKFDVLEKLRTNKNYEVAPLDIQKMAEDRLRKFWGATNPVQTQNPASGGLAGGGSQIQESPSISFNKMYEYLSPLEKSAKAYTKSGEAGSTALGQGTNLASHALRGYLDSKVPQTARIANDIYGAASKIQPYAQKFARISIPSLLLYQLIRNAFNSQD